MRSASCKNSAIMMKHEPEKYFSQLCNLTRRKNIFGRAQIGIIDQINIYSKSSRHLAAVSTKASSKKVGKYFMFPAEFPQFTVCYVFFSAVFLLENSQEVACLLLQQLFKLVPVTSILSLIVQIT
jgi:hypothetical protein